MPVFFHYGTDRAELFRKAIKHFKNAELIKTVWHFAFSPFFLFWPEAAAPILLGLLLMLLALLLLPLLGVLMGFQIINFTRNVHDGPLFNLIS